MTLAELQQCFAEGVYQSDSVAARDLIIGDAKSSAQERLFIYQYAYEARLHEALQTDYPGLFAYLGETDFKRLAQDYSQHYPSQHPSLRWFGRHLAVFLREHYPRQAVLSEMAAFEWALGESFDAADKPCASVADLQAIPAESWGDLKLELTPSLRNLDLYWNAPQIWRALDQSASPPPAERSDYPVRWIVWRQGLNPHWRSLAVDEAWALAELEAGADIATVCAGLTEWLDESQIPQRVLGFLRIWLDEELVVRVHPI